MKKFLHPLIFLLMISATSLAQTELFSDNFDSYSTSQKLAEQSSASEWTTWSGSPGSGEDAAITTEYAYSLDNSAKLVADNDLVLDLGGKTSGRYQVKFYLYMPTDKACFLGYMQDFNGSNTEFGTSIYFDADTGKITAGGREFPFGFDYNKWMLINFVVDLDDDFASFSIDDEIIAAWKWSTGSDGASSTLKLDGIDFWGHSSSSQYYLDDLAYNELGTFDNPFNLMSSLTEDDVTLTWEAPGTGSPSGYAIFRNDVYIGQTTNLTYTDVKVYPGEYFYTVRAIYGDNGLSAATNEESETISGGVDRSYVLYEIGTGTWCQYCPGAAMGVHDMFENNLDVAVVKYHYDDDYEFEEGLDRINYYSIVSYPSTKVDGVFSHIGGSNSQSLYDTYKPSYDERIEILSTHGIEIQITKTDATHYQVAVTVTEEYEYFESDLNLIIALTESNIADSWQNQTEVNFACRGLYPDGSGTSLDFSSNSTQVVNADVVLDDSWVAENCEIVAFVQHNTSKEIVQAIKTELVPPSVNISIADQSTNVKLDEDIVFTFSDPIRHLSGDTIEAVDSMITFKKDGPTGEDFAFVASINDDFTEITVSHDSLDENTTYYVELSSYIENFYDMQVVDALNTTFTTETLTGIVNKNEIEKLNIYPNPFSNQLNITFYSEGIGNAVIEIYNMSGVLVKQQVEEVTVGEPLIRVNTEGMANGIYFLNLNLGDKQVSKKVILLK